MEVFALTNNFIGDYANDVPARKAPSELAGERMRRIGR